MSNIGDKVISLIDSSILNKGDIFNIFDVMNIDNNTYYKIFIENKPLIKNKSQYFFIDSKNFTTIEEWRKIRIEKILT